MSKLFNELPLQNFVQLKRPYLQRFEYFNGKADSSFKITSDKS